MTQFNWNEGNLNWLKCKCQINLHTNCRFSVIGARNQSIPEMPFSSEMPASTQYQRTVPVLVQSRSAVNCNEKNPAQWLSIHFQPAERLFVQLCRFGLWRDVLTNITMISRTKKGCMLIIFMQHVSHVEAGCALCIFIDTSIMMHLYIHLHRRCLLMLLPLSQAMLSLGCRECLAERVFCLRIITLS